VALNRAKVAADITVGADGTYFVIAAFFDIADPATILWEETMQMSAASTVPQLQARVIERGQTIRQYLANQASARAQVPLGTTVTVP
jgi:hypothetical protein